MSELTLIVLARAVHVMAGVAWAGAMFVMALVVMPLASRYADQGAGRWLGMVVQRAGQLSGISAMLTVLSGIYLFAVLHAHDDSASGLVLKAGAVAAVVSMVLGIVVGRRTGMELVRLEAENPTDAAATAARAARLATLRSRAKLSTRLTAALLGFAVLSMAVFRYATALV